MGRKKIPGLYKRKGKWHVDKQIFGKRICESTGTSDITEAEKYLAHRIDQLRESIVFGVRPKRTFREAVFRYIEDKSRQGKATLADDIKRIKHLDPFIGKLPLCEIHMGTLQDFIDHRRKAGVKNATINHELKVVRQILRLAATEWIDEHGKTWILQAPRIRMFDTRDARKPYPLSWEEQERLFKELPKHLKDMALFAVNTGCRDAEVCNLRWEWEHDVPELGVSVFIIPAWVVAIENGQKILKGQVKNREDRLVVLNRIASQVIENRRGQHPEFVFAYRGKANTRMLNSGWQWARERAELPGIRVHDLKHTFGRRLRAAGVSFEDRQDLLGHKSGRITTHYSAAELGNLLIAVNSVCKGTCSKPTLTLVRRSMESKKLAPAKIPQGVLRLVENDS